MSTMKVLGEGVALCAQRASLVADGFRRGAFGRFQKVPPPKSFPLWRLLSISRSASSRCRASSFSFALFALARERCPARVAASYGAKKWREDCSEPLDLRTVLFFRPEEGTGRLVSRFREPDWVSKGSMDDGDWSIWVWVFGDSVFWLDKTAGDWKTGSTLDFNWSGLVFGISSDVSRLKPCRKTRAARELKGRVLSPRALASLSVRKYSSCCKSLIRVSN